MCGIVGCSWADKAAVSAMSKAIAHRGPDDKGIWNDTKVTFGQQRLSIIDLSPLGHQPMIYKRKGRTAVITFNGEIYNFQEIRNELLSLGYEFKSASDTEVILASYFAWGHDCVKKFNGMWAFCLYDVEKQQLFCSRDRVGKKPFYYYAADGKFIFASELKGILTQKTLRINRRENIDTEAVQLYFSLGFIPAPLTIYKSVRKLEARHNLLYDLKLKRVVRIWTYYEIPPYNPQHDRAALVQEARSLLRDAVRLRMIADVPVGAFLSGGLDSSTVVGEMAAIGSIKNLHTFSIGFEGKYDETPYINIVKNAFGTQHHHWLFTKKDLDRLWPKFPEMYDEPFWDYSGFPTARVSELAREYVTVALSGDGGDEVFGGYMTHVTGYRMDMIRKLPRLLRKAGAKIPAKKNLGNFANLYLLKGAMDLSLHDPAEFYARALVEDGIKPAAYKKWTTEKLRYCLDKSGGRLGEALRLYDLLYHTIPDLFLTKVDRASMSTALEVRSPFLDYRLLELGQRIPVEWKIDAFKTKKLMREVISGIVPEEIITRGKQGFTPPLEEWVQGPEYQQPIQDALALIQTVDAEIYDFYAKQGLVEKNRMYTNYMIRLLLFHLWWKRWIGK